MTTENCVIRAGISPVEFAGLAANLVAAGIVTTSSSPAPENQPQSAMQRAIEGTLVFLELCSEALSARTNGDDHASAALAIAASANRIKNAAYEAFNNSPPPTAEALERIGESRVWESLSGDSKSEVRKKLARAPIGEFLREANVGILPPTEHELGSIGEARAWASIPAAEQSNSIFRLLTNHMIVHGSEQIPALTDAVISEYGKEGIPVELAEGILWHLKLSNENRQASREKGTSLVMEAEGVSDEEDSEIKGSSTNRNPESTTS
ncbi:hypothetical protein [Verrucomicrobium sp. BvORR106]|uniref:hypothetical protein n=1 Tax=Verrucomicrobium sp. BvORR106 TaxID=1403819 RepID=UPI002240E91F|nr:hypothetical protein [Verrucomicrobium sp. BvORR106]